MKRIADDGERESIELAIAAIVAGVLGLDRVEIGDDLYDLGADSQQAVLVALEIEHHFGVDLPLEVMERTGSIHALADWVIEQTAMPVRMVGYDDR